MTQIFKKAKQPAVAVFILLLMQCSTKKKMPVDYVDPFICTEGDHGQLFPGAVVPFGMVKLSPDTYPSSLTGNGDWAHSGYNYADNHIRGFSHLRIGSSGGTAIYDRSWLVSVLPMIGEPQIAPEKRVAAIDKKSEQASPGIYQVALSDYKIHAALTVDAHVGFHKYIFPESQDAHIIIDMGSPAFIRESSVRIIGNDELTGHLVGPGDIYFSAKISKPFQSFSTYENDITTAQKELTGKKVGAILDFNTSENEVIFLKVGFSTISVEQARKNLDAEVPAWDFDGTVQRARNAWENLLNTISVEGYEEYKTIFYTALYHSYIQPSNITDADGKYHGYDRQIHETDGYTFYDNYAFWDSYRTKYPLFSLTVPGVMKDIVRSILDIHEQSGEYWFYGDEEHKPHSHGFNSAGQDGYRPFLNCRNEHMLTVVLDAYAKGIVTTEKEKAYQEMVNEVMVQMPDKYEAIGYIPARPDQTCELSYDNWCVAQMAKAVGRERDYQKFMKRAAFYQNTWDSDIGFFRARKANGEWLDFPESPDINREKYMYEGTPRQWRWFVPHDVQGLINLIGSREKFVEELDYFFSNDLYQAGNQPDLHAPFLFNYGGAPWLTQKWVRKILTEPMTQLYGTHGFFEEPIHDRIYKATPDGYLREMDDDYGSMAAWYVLSAVGLFQVCPGQPVYQLTAPIFDKVIVKLDEEFFSGKEFIIEAQNLSDKNIYIQSLKFYNEEFKNGKLYTKTWISHQDVVNGGKLVFEMGPVPNKERGNAIEEAPPSMSKPHN